MQLRNIVIFASLLFTVSSTCLAAGKSTGFKCWVNKQGIRECGNEVPPEYSQGETRTVNKSGLTTNVEARAKTKAELEAEKRAQEEQEKTQKSAQETAQEKEKAEKEQQARDRVLLASYINEEDIEAARKRKLSAIDAAIEMSNNNIKKLEEKLSKEEQKADALKKSGKEVSAEDKNDMDSLHKQIDNKKIFIATKEKEKETINLEYDSYVKRYRELNAGKKAK